jgi:small subunit ribosomal protein S2
MPYVTDRWLGGMMTNFATIRRSVKKMNNLEQMLTDGTLSSTTKKERLTLTREMNKLNKVLGGISDINRLPHAVFIVDIGREHLALAEAKKLGIKTFAMVDTNADPNLVDFPVPANDDSSKSISSSPTTSPMRSKKDWLSVVKRKKRWLKKLLRSK